MKSVLLVAAGGAIGSVLRFKLSSWILQQTVIWRFPLGTFLVNVIGCCVMGLLAGFALRDSSFTPHARLFLMTGILGGFTTFSAFGLETFHLLRRDEVGVALIYVVLSLICSLLALWAGFSATHDFNR
ncbi:fluoride efflux transporter CrcB [Massilia sp. H6]|uniref:fluoride efflux transporter CrcB n=1 Tax=Massilia sp. H6 TaxID=2970464 RepID=UPI00216A8F3D|nr:fluoride efflux transporter CrcB [Massilia sp. H6]UVW30631.1 fluoride efflux transporter CrcB [Massilia sp. H6]